MTLPTNGGQIWPNGGANPATLIEGVRAFVRPTDLTALSLGATRTFLGITGGSGPASGDDDQIILPGQIFGA